MNKRTKIFLLILVVLITLGTFFDYQITNALNGRLTFIADSTEIFGELPFVLSLVVPFVIYFNWRDREHRIKSNVLGIFYSLLGLFFSYFTFFMIFQYAAESTGGDSHGEVTQTMNLVALLLGVLLYTGLVYFSKKIEIKDVMRLKHAAHKMLLFSFSTVLLTNLIKIIFARPRYWTILEGVHEYAPWYQINGPQLNNATMSFISGHTANAFVLFAFAYFFSEGSKNRKNVITATMIWGSLVGVGRLLSGQHFLTDVVFAGLLTTGLYLLIDKKVRFREKTMEVKLNKDSEQAIKEVQSNDLETAHSVEELHDKLHAD